MGSLPVILDMDPGVDDALAMMLALGSPEIEVLGISTVHGNVPLGVGTQNALRVLGLLDRTGVPVYPGAARPLVRGPVYATEVHGPEGLGEAVLPDPDVPPAGDGVGFLVETLSARPGEVTLVAVGPLTNLAMAEQQVPGVLREARQVIVMGGAIKQPGNSTPTAEFNFYADPDAAGQVVRSGASLTLMPLDVTRRVGLDVEGIQHRVAPPGTPEARFVEAAVQSSIAYAKRVYGYAGIYLHDPLAVGLAIDPSFFKLAPVFLEVETEGRLTAGQAVADRRPFLEDANRQGHRVMCAVEVEAERFLEWFLERALEEVGH